MLVKWCYTLKWFSSLCNGYYLGHRSVNLVFGVATYTGNYVGIVVLDKTGIALINKIEIHRLFVHSTPITKPKPEIKGTLLCYKHLHKITLIPLQHSSPSVLLFICLVVLNYSRCLYVFIISTFVCLATTIYGLVGQIFQFGSWYRWWDK